MTLAASSPSSVDGGYPARAYGWYVVAVLILAYTVSYIDRTMLTLLVGPIRASLHISDLQLSLLHGLAFAIFYTFLGIPIGRAADRLNRRNIIVGGVLVWSVMTACCGLARNFGQLFLARVGVGVGEATLSPCAYSMLADYFPPKSLTKALSVYTAAMYMGAGIALLAGGALIAAVPAVTLPIVGALAPWQVVFLLIGAPGVLVAVLMTTIREPARMGLAAGWTKPPSFRQVLAFVRGRAGAYGLLVAGYSASSLMWNGSQGWIPAFFMRTYHWTAPQVGLRYGSTLLVFGVAGIVFGGYLAGRLRARGLRSANLLVGMISALAVAPFGVTAPLVSNAGLALGLYAAFIFAGSIPYGAAAAALQEITPNQMRAQVSALYLFGLNLAGIGLGPTVVAFLTDKVFHADAAVGHSLALTVAVAAPISALLLWLGARPYRRALDAKTF